MNYGMIMVDYLHPIQNRDVSQRRNLKTKTGIIINNNRVTLESLVKESKTRWIETEWGFPKGRRNYNEKDLLVQFVSLKRKLGIKKMILTLFIIFFPMKKFLLDQISNPINTNILYANLNKILLMKRVIKKVR